MIDKPINDLFFDLDDTLWDFQKNSALTFAFIFKKQSLPINLSEFMAVYSPINEAYWRRYREGEVDKTTLRLGRLTDTFKVLKKEVPVDLVTRLSQDYNLHLADFNHLLPGTEATLSYLSNRYNLHILSNGFGVGQRLKMKNAGIDSFFNSVTTPDDAGAKKPNPAIFKAALVKAKATKESSVMIGDNLEVDVRGAEQAGFYPIYFNPYEDSDYIGHQIKTIAELKAIF